MITCIISRNKRYPVIFIDPQRNNMEPSTKLFSELTYKSHVQDGDEDGDHDDAPKKSDMRYWTDYCTHSLTSVLRASNSYSVDEQAAHLAFLNKHVVPSLGPRTSKGLTQYTIYSLTHNGSPMESSFNFSADKENPIVRFSFVPLGPAGGTERDPFGQDAAMHVLGELAEVSSDCDARWMRAFQKTFFLTDEETEMAKKKLSQDDSGHKTVVTRVPPHCMVAFDLHGPKRYMKAYYVPALKEIATEKSREDMCFPTIRNLEPYGNELTPACDLLASYIAELDPKTRPNLDIVGIDCLDPDKHPARIKVYYFSETCDFNSVRSFVTLGGRVKDETTRKGLEFLREIWHLLLDEPDGIEDDDWSKPPKNPNGAIARGVAYAVEMVPGNPVPDIKVHVPRWQYARSDIAIAENMEAILQKLGSSWAEHGKYERIVREAYGDEDFHGSKIIHCFLSYLMRENGVYLSTYFANPLSNRT